MNRFLLCAPDFYGIRYEINPWMDRARAVDHPRAVAQWEGLRCKLESLGAKLEHLQPQPEWPDMVFTANAGLTHHGRMIVSRFRHAERAGETPWFEQWLESQPYQACRLPAGCAFEGEGDALFCGSRLVCASPYRTDETAHGHLGRVLGCETVSLRLTDPRFYHLDTCFCPLPDGSVIWHPPAFDEASQARARSLAAERIEVLTAEAERFACNAIPLGRDIVLPDGCERLCAALETRGFRAHPLPMSEFIKAGGACKCLVLRL